MKADLVTIFPKLVFDRGERDKQEQAKDQGIMSEIYYLGAHITSYRNLTSQSSCHKNEVIECVKQTHQNIVDSDKKPFDDFVVVVDENIDWNSTDPPNPPSVDLIAYFFNLKSDASVSLDFGKIMLPRVRDVLPQDPYRYRRRQYIDNCRVSWGDHSPWVLPISQWWQTKIRLRQKEEGSLVKALSNLHRNQIELHERLTIAIDLFNQSCRTSLFHRNVALVLIVSAFEALFNVPKDIHKKSLVVPYVMQVYLGFDKDVANEVATLYKLRNKVVHGEMAEEKKTISSDQFYSHYEVAKNLFEACFRFVLEQYGALRISLRDKSVIKKQVIDLIASNDKKIEKAIKLLDRFPDSTQDYSQKGSLVGEFIKTLSVLNPDDRSASDKEVLFSYLKAALLVARKEIESEKEYLRLPHLSNTQLGVRQRVPSYDEIERIFREIENIMGRSQNKFKVSDRLKLDSRINDLLQVTGDMAGFGSFEIRHSGYSVREFVSRSFGAIRAFWKLRSGDDQK